MTDHELEALRQALEAWNNGETLYSEGSEALLQAASVVIEHAAREFLRLMETGETVEWCLEHESPGDVGLSCAHFLADEVEGYEAEPCRMVSAVLTRREP